MSVVCLLGFSSCEKDDGGLAGTTWTGSYDGRDYGASSSNYVVEYYTYTFSTTTCNIKHKGGWYNNGSLTSEAWDYTDTYFYSEENYPTIVITNNSNDGSIYYLHIENNSFTHYYVWRPAPIYKK